MIKRIFLFSLFVIGTFFTSYADEKKDIILNEDDHRTETIEHKKWNIFVSLKSIDDKNNVQIEVQLENTSDSYNLCLFDSAYDVKELKKMKPSIRYDKGCPKSIIEACSDIKIPIKLSPSKKTDLFVKTGNLNAPIICKLPIYIAKNKNKRGTKILLWDIVVIEIEIQVQKKPDSEYIKIEESYNTLIKDINSEIFCTNENHKGSSFKTLKNKYEKEINDLKKNINTIIVKRFESGKDIKKFRLFIDGLDTISIDSKKVDNCVCDTKKTRPVKTRPVCKYENLSYKEIYERLNNYSIDIYNGLSKSKVMSEVESLYKCALQHTKQHSKRKDTDYKSGITKCYNRIKSY